MDVDALTMEERGMLLRQGKCFRCKKTGHMAKDCPPEQGVIEAEEGGPSKVCLYHNQSTYQGAERKLYKDGYGGQG
jgi:Zinc knuckle